MSRTYFMLRDGYKILAIHQIRDSAEACMEYYINSGTCTMCVELLQISVNDHGFAQGETVLKMYSPLTGVYSDCSGNLLPPPPIRIPRSRTSKPA